MLGSGGGPGGAVRTSAAMPPQNAVDYLPIGQLNLAGRDSQRCTVSTVVQTSYVNRTWAGKCKLKCSSSTFTHCYVACGDFSLRSKEGFRLSIDAPWPNAFRRPEVYLVGKNHVSHSLSRCLELPAQCQGNIVIGEWRSAGGNGRSQAPQQVAPVAAFISFGGLGAWPLL